MKKMQKEEKKNKNIVKNNVDGLELFALIASVFYVHSVNTNLHHYLYWRTVESPTFFLAAVALACVAYTTNKNKRLSRLGVATVAIILTASLIWLSGFRVNAYPLR